MCGRTGSNAFLATGISCSCLVGGSEEIDGEGDQMREEVTFSMKD